MTGETRPVKNEKTRDARSRIQQRSLFFRILMLGISVMLVSQIIISWIALEGFEVEFEPQLNQKAIAVGRAISSELSYAINDLGIPSDQLFGVSDYFNETLNSNPDILFLALLDVSSHIMFENGLPKQLTDRLQTSNQDLLGSIGESYKITDLDDYLDGAFPVYSNGQLDSVLHVGVTQESAQNHISSVFYEVVAVIVVSMFVTLEFLVMFMNRHVSGPMTRIASVLSEGAKGMFISRLVMRSRNEIGLMVGNLNRLLYHLEQRYQDFRFELRELEEAQIDKSIAEKIAVLKNQANQRYGFSGKLGLTENFPSLIRIPLFLFIFSEELSRSFFPLFVSGFIPIQTVISYEMMIGLPITLFMMAMFIATLFAGGLTHRLGCSRLFLVGITCALIGYFGTFISQNYMELIFWRCLNGIGYGLIFNACETWVALHAKHHDRAQSASSFVGAVFAGLVCGPPLGGMFADYVGQQATFLISAGLALISGYAAYRLLSRSEENTGQKEHHLYRVLPHFRDWRILFGNLRFIGVILTAIPTKMTVSSFLFFIVPLYLNQLGLSHSQIGQMLMLYGVVAVIGTPLIARWADYMENHGLIVGIGSAVSGLGLLAVLGGGSSMVLVAIVAVSIGHCLILSPQNAIVQQIAHQYRYDINLSVVLGIYRFVDRIGMMIGPILAAILIQALSYVGAVASIGGIVIFSTLLFALAMNYSNRSVQGISIR